jgi:putative SOS response-associated peptidase YedK
MDTVEDGRTREMLIGSFGLIPHWAQDTKIARNTFNARSETAAQKPSFRDAWKIGRRCIIPAEAIYEPDWRSGKAIPAKISRADGKPIGIAGLWSYWKSPKGEEIHSYTMLTINAESHPIMNQFHKPADEKRMVVILHDDQYSDWLDVPATESVNFLNQYPAELLVATSKQTTLI